MPGLPRTIGPALPPSGTPAGSPYGARSRADFDARGLGRFYDMLMSNDPTMQAYARGQLQTLAPELLSETPSTQATGYTGDEPAQAFLRRRGRLPTTAELPFALSDLARERATGGLASPVGEPGGIGESSEAVNRVALELAPILQGAGGNIFRRLAGDLDLDYARYATGENAPTFYDYLRQKAQTLTHGGTGEQFGVQPVTWGQVTGPAAPQMFTEGDEGVGRNAVLGAWLAQYAPNRNPDVRQAVQRRLGQYAQNYPTIGSGEGFGDYIGRMMQGYL